MPWKRKAEPSDFDLADAGKAALQEEQLDWMSYDQIDGQIIRRCATIMHASATVTKFEIRRGTYYDSAMLMQLQSALAALKGVADAGVVMATPANLELLEQIDMLPNAAQQAGSDDLLIVVRAKTDKQASAALIQVDELLARRRSAIEEAFRPRSLEAAVKMLPEARWVLVSVPGRYAAGVARQAMKLGRNVFLYSDNVSLEEEVALKRMAIAEKLLLMGPDCGTAIVNRVGLGFANRVRRGEIGIVAASGTGLQAVAARIHALGAGVSHALGTGGRDLKQEVAAITARQSLDLLSRDPQTRVIVLVSKPPDADVAAHLLGSAQAAGKPVVVHFMGFPPPAQKLGNLYFALNLSQAASMAVDTLNGQGERPGAETAEAAPPTKARRFLRGLFSGGSLAYEALLGLQLFLGRVYANAPIHPSQGLADPLKSQEHTIIDLGEDVFTVGRLHPMLDNDLRLRRLQQEAADPEVAMILLDVVLGEGAHPDPASELAPAIADVRRKHGVEVVAVLVGTDEDPQDLEAQRKRLLDAGAQVFEDVSQALVHINRRLGWARPETIAPVPLECLTEPLSAINVGIETFYQSLTTQGASVVQVDWRPPAGGDEKLMAILEKMRK
ncbi:MAG: acyl-CoA synthetase FdrA [Anaerolineales bacterium]|jgi:FdrA protein